MIRYHDTLRWTEPGVGDRAVIPANVYGTDGAALNDDGVIRARLSLRATVPTFPEPMNPVTDRIAWRGMSLRLVGLPIPRMRRGTVHHYTLELEAMT